MATMKVHNGRTFWMETAGRLQSCERCNADILPDETLYLWETYAASFVACSAGCAHKIAQATE